MSNRYPWAAHYHWTSARYRSGSRLGHWISSQAAAQGLGLGSRAYLNHSVAFFDTTSHLPNSSDWLYISWSHCCFENLWVTRNLTKAGQCLSCFVGIPRSFYHHPHMKNKSLILGRILALGWLIWREEFVYINHLTTSAMERKWQWPDRQQNDAIHSSTKKQESVQLVRLTTQTIYACETSNQGTTIVYYDVPPLSCPQSPPLLQAIPRSEHTVSPEPQSSQRLCPISNFLSPIMRARPIFKSFSSEIDGVQKISTQYVRTDHSSNRTMIWLMSDWRWRTWWWEVFAARIWAYYSMVGKRVLYLGFASFCGRDWCIWDRRVMMVGALKLRCVRRAPS